MLSYVGLGSNLSDPKGQLNAALVQISSLPDTTLQSVSAVYKTAPVGLSEQPDFFNQVVLLETKLSAMALLDALQCIENTLGRVREQHWGPRVIDCDILLYGDDIISTPRLTVPHPYMKERAFVLVPLAEITPDFIFPATGEQILTLCAAVSDQIIEREQAE